MLENSGKWVDDFGNRIVAGKPAKKMTNGLVYVVPIAEINQNQHKH